MEWKPISLLAVAAVLAIGGCGKKEAPEAPVQAPGAAPTAQAPASATAEPAATPSTTTSAASVATGEGVFMKACRACHEQGIAGAPRIGDKADWGPRIAQGKDVLYQHSIQGFTGKKGMMPPKGGFTTLSDDEVKAAVDYMASRAQ